MMRDRSCAWCKIDERSAKTETLPFTLESALMTAAQAGFAITHNGT
jgi:hypothetical protein